MMQPSFKNHESPDFLENVERNIRSLLEQEGITLRELSIKLQLPYSNLQRIISGESRDPKVSIMKKISEYFCISIEDLFANKIIELNRKNLFLKPKAIPKFDWETLQNQDTSKIDLKSWETWQVLTTQPQESSEHVFAVESTASMFPRFPHGTIFIIDPEITPADGDIVLVRFLKTNETGLKELVIDPPDKKLKSLVPDSKQFILEKDEIKIIGTNVMTLLFPKQ